MRRLGSRLAAAAVLVATTVAVTATHTTPPPRPVALQRAAAPAAADLAVQLQALLGQHSVLAADLMRSRIRGDDDFVQAANAALGRNTSDMTALVGRLFGAETAEAFQPRWSRHILSLFAYAGALAEHDAVARQKARAEVAVRENELATFFAGGSHGRLTPTAARSLISIHVRHLTGQADAYAAGDYARADTMDREGFEHTYDLGLLLAGALLPPADTAVLAQPVWRLRSQLGRLLAEHAVLIEDTTRAAVTRTPDFTASAAMLNANTSDLAAAIDTLFDAAAARKFQSIWGTHVEALVAYSAAAAARDPARQQRARDKLTTFQQTMGQFLAGATAGRGTAEAFQAALSVHDRALLDHADAYAVRDYAQAHEIADHTYDHMFDLARTLADAFGATVAARLPTGAAQTGHGGMAGVVEHR